jgi:hypothetical protein
VSGSLPASLRKRLVVDSADCPLIAAELFHVGSPNIAGIGPVDVVDRF